MEGTLTIPLRVIEFSDITSLRINKGSRVYIDFDGGSVDCDFDEFWASISEAYKAGIKGLVETVAGLSGDDITVSGDF